MSEQEAPPRLTRTVLRGASVAGIGYFGAQVITLGFYLALARLATPSDFGELAAGSILVGVGLLITDSGMLAALVQRRDRINEAANTAVISTFLAGIAFSLIAFALSPLVGEFFGSDRIGEVAAVMSALIWLRVLDLVPSALMQREFRFVRRTVIEPLSALAFGIAAVIACSKGLGVWGLVIGQYAAAVVEFILSWALGRWRPHPGAASYGMWKELVGYGRHVFLATVIQRVGDQADTIWLGRFLGSAPLGQYRYAFRLASTPFMALLAAAGYVLFPAFSRIATERDRFEQAFFRSLRWISIIGFPAGLIMLPLGEPLAVFLFGDVWQEAGQAAGAMALFCGGSCLGSVAGEALKAHGTTQALTRMHTFTTVLTAALMGALLTFGLNGVAAALSIGALAGGGYALVVAHRTIGFPLRPMWTEIWPAIAASAVMAAVLLPLEQWLNTPSRDTLEAGFILLGELLIGAGIYAIALRIFGPSLLEELRAPATKAWARLVGPPDATPAGPDLPATPLGSMRPAPTADAQAWGPHCSVVMPAYNAAASVGAAIRSVIAQTETDWELIVIDDGSDDETARVAREFETDRRVFVHTQPNGGPAAARNRGIRFARGKYVSFLDSDDLLLPTYLDEMRRALDADPSSAIAFTDAWSLDDDTRKVYVETAMEAAAPPDSPPRDHTELLTRLIRGNFILASAMVRREVLESAGGYDPATTGAEDYDLWLRIVIAGHGVSRVPGLLVVQRESGQSFSKDLPRLFGALRDIYARLAADESLPPDAREAARARQAWNADHVDSLTRESPGAVIARRLRRRAASVRRRVRPRPTYDEPPEQLTRAFGDLRDL